MSDLKGPNTAYGQSASPSGIQSGGAGTRQAALSAIEQLVEGLGGPINDISRAVYEHGGTFYNTDAPALHLLSGGQIGSVAVKPGSTKQERGFLNLPAAIDRVLDPFHPTTFHLGSAGTNPLGKPEGHIGPSSGSFFNKPEGHL
jgi:hypothetical protein